MPGYSDDKDAVQRRLRRIEGQVRGLQCMVEEDSYCIDVLTQISATTRAVESVALELLGDHLGHCVREAVAQGGSEADDEVREAPGDRTAGPLLSKGVTCTIDEPGIPDCDSGAIGRLRFVVEEVVEIVRRPSRGGRRRRV